MSKALPTVHDNNVLKVIQEGGLPSRADISRQLNIPILSVDEAIRSLEKQELIEREAER